MDTKIALLSVPLENDYKHTLYFKTPADQLAYFNGKVIEWNENYSYQRKDNIIRYPAHYDYLSSKAVNYVMYQNKYYGNKWFYAFIKEKKYVNDSMTELHIETDVIQTYLFDYQVKTSFIEREHVDNDTPGMNLVDEGFAISDYIVNHSEVLGYGNWDGTEAAPYYIVIGVTEQSNGDKIGMRVHNGIPSGIAYYACPVTLYTKVNEFVKAYDTAGKSEAIVCMFLAPTELIKPYLTGTEGFVAESFLTQDFYINNPNESASATNRIFEFTVGTIDGYVPANLKLLTYPYRYLLVSNNNGTEVIYRFENFSTNGTGTYSIKPSFLIQGCLTPGCSIRMIPRYYKNQFRYDIEGINLGKYPTLNWTSDYYTNWLTQNGINIGIQAVTGLGSLAVGGATGNIGMAVGGVSMIADTINSMYQADLIPHQSHGNINCGDVVTASRMNDFLFFDMCLKKEQAQIIDGYFTMFGYKVNRVGVPLKNHRSRFWYTKTVDCNIDGGIANEDLNKIKECYNNGITFWRSSETIGDYSAQNIIKVV